MKYVKPIVLCIVIGVLMGLFLYSGYEKKINLLPTFKSGENILFLRLGSYKDEISMEKSLENLDNYIYQKENDMYTVYIGITKLEENFKKLKEFYQKRGYIIDKQSFYIENKDFLEGLKMYDELLIKTNDDSLIETIVNGVLAKYEECANDQ